MAAFKVSDGKSVSVVATAAHQNGDYVFEHGWHGMAQADLATRADGSIAVGDAFVIQVDQAEYQLGVPAAVGVNVGDTIFITPAGVLAATSNAGANVPVLKVTEARDANGVCKAKQLPQRIG